MGAEHDYTSFNNAAKARGAIPYDELPDRGWIKDFRTLPPGKTVMIPPNHRVFHDPAPVKGFARLAVLQGLNIRYAAEDLDYEILYWHDPTTRAYCIEFRKSTSHDRNTHVQALPS